MERGGETREGNETQWHFNWDRHALDWVRTLTLILTCSSTAMHHTVLQSTQCSDFVCGHVCGMSATSSQVFCRLLNYRLCEPDFIKGSVKIYLSITHLFKNMIKWRCFHADCIIIMNTCLHESDSFIPQPGLCVCNVCVCVCVCVCMCVMVDGVWRCKCNNVCMFMSARDLVQPRVTADVAWSLSSVASDVLSADLQ